MRCGGASTAASKPVQRRVGGQVPIAAEDRTVCSRTVARMRSHAHSCAHTNAPMQERTGRPTGRHTKRKQTLTRLRGGKLRPRGGRVCACTVHDDRFCDGVAKQQQLPEPATCKMQHATCSRRRATCNMRLATCNPPGRMQPTCKARPRGNLQHAVRDCTMQHSSKMHTCSVTGVALAPLSVAHCLLHAAC